MNDHSGLGVEGLYNNAFGCVIEGRHLRHVETDCLLKILRNARAGAVIKLSEDAMAAYCLTVCSPRFPTLN